MWIRSQDGKTLSNVNDLYVRVIGKGYAISSDKCDLGKYSTEQKALNVMDGIQNCLCRGTKSYHPVEPLSVINGFPPYKIEREKVFQMPKDDEVEV